MMCYMAGLSSNMAWLPSRLAQVLVMISAVVIIAHHEVDCGMTVHNIA